MLRLIVLAVLTTMVLGHVEFDEDHEVLVAKEDLPAGTLVRLRRQVFGGVNRFPGGGFNKEVGYRGSNAWGSLSQNVNRFGQSSPISYNGGLGAGGDRGSLSLSGSHVPHAGSSATLGGNLNLYNGKQDQLSAHASHTKIFDPKFKEIGRGTNSAGLGYQHNSKDGQTSWNVGTNTNFGQGRKPDHSINVGVEHRF